jgi:hypothetical protein
MKIFSFGMFCSSQFFMMSMVFKENQRQNEAISKKSSLNEKVMKIKNKIRQVFMDPYDNRPSGAFGFR